MIDENSGNFPVPVMDEYKTIEMVGMYAIKGYKDSEIAELLDITRYKVKKYREDYNNLVQAAIDNNPDFLEQTILHTKMLLAELEEISKEAWESVEAATNEGMINARIQALRLATEVNAKKGALLHVGQAGGPGKTDQGFIDRMHKAERVNGILSSVIQTVIADCERCRERARVDLAEAFSMLPAYDAEAEIIEDE